MSLSVLLLMASVARAEWGCGVAAADPIGATCRVWMLHRLAVQTFAGARVLCPTGEPCQIPGPLIAADLTAHAPKHRKRERLTGGFHAGLGFGVGTMGSGCWTDSISLVCVDSLSPHALVRVPFGAELQVGPVELGAEIVPAYRLMPDPYPTFMGGLSVRFYP